MTAPVRRPLWLLLAWPLWVHGCVLLGRPGWALVGIVVLVLSVGIARGWAGDWRSAAVWLGLAGLLAAAVGQGWAQPVLYLPPVLFSLVFFVVFAGSLVSGRTPLVTELALRMGERPTPAVRAYTRRVTQAWALFFAFLGGTALVLALAASPTVWSWYANFGTYLLVGLFFLVEFRLRDRFMPGHRFRRFGDFLRALAANGMDRR